MMRHLENSGFDSVEFRCWDLPSMYEPYLPAPSVASPGSTTRRSTGSARRT